MSGVLMTLVDALHDAGDVSVERWGDLAGEFDEAQLLDLTMLVVRLDPRHQLHGRSRPRPARTRRADDALRRTGTTPEGHSMQIAIVTFDGYNEIDSFVALHILNRMRPDGWRAEIIGPTPTVTSMNGVVIHTQGPLDAAQDADVVLFGSGIGGREAARAANLRDRIVVDPARQLVGAQCSGTLLMAALGLLDGLPACTDLATKPWVVEAGVEVLDQPFVAHGSRATAGGCLSSTYLSAWVLATLAGRDQAASVLRTVAPVGETSFVDHALATIGPYLTSSPAIPLSTYTARTCEVSGGNHAVS